MVIGVIVVKEDEESSTWRQRERERDDKKGSGLEGEKKVGSRKIDRDEQIGQTWKYVRRTWQILTEQRATDTEKMILPLPLPLREPEGHELCLFVCFFVF